MTTKERQARIERIQKYLEEGKSKEWIAKKLGIAVGTLKNIISLTRTPSSDVNKFNCVYPGLRKWLMNNNMTRNEFFLKVADDFIDIASFKKVLDGSLQLKYKHIIPILKATGCTFEEIFMEKQ